MFRYTCHLLSVASAFLAAASLVNAQPGASYTSRRIISTDRNPFTHVAYIPADADQSSIRFAGFRAVKLPTRTSSTMDERYCEDVLHRDPGGSMYCPLVGHEGYTLVYEVSYSYDGPPLPSDEYGGRHFAFSVYFRPEEFSLREQEALLQRKGAVNGTRSFQLSTHREFEPRVVVDQANSVFCEGSFVEGLWVHTDAKCKDTIRSKTITVPSGFITVRVEPAFTVASLSNQ